MVDKRVRSEFLPEQSLMEMNVYSFIFHMQFAAQNKSVCNLQHMWLPFFVFNFNLLFCLVLLKHDNVLMYT